METGYADNFIKYNVPPKDVEPARNLLDVFPWHISAGIGGLELYTHDCSYQLGPSPNYVYHLVLNIGNEVLEILPDPTKPDYEVRGPKIYPCGEEKRAVFDLLGAKHGDIPVRSLLVYFTRDSFFRLCRRWKANGGLERFLRKPEIPKEETAR